MVIDNGLLRIEGASQGNGYRTLYPDATSNRHSIGRRQAAS
jgi:hypothetical protein